MRTALVLPQNDLIWNFMKGLNGFILTWTFHNFRDFYEKKKKKKKKKRKIVKSEKLAKVVSTNKKNPEHI